MRAGSLKPPVLSTTWEQKMAAKAERAAFTSARTSAVEARKAKKWVGGALGWGVAGDRGEGVGRSGQEWAGVGRLLALCRALPQPRSSSHQHLPHPFLSSSRFLAGRARETGGGARAQGGQHRAVGSRADHHQGVDAAAHAQVQKGPQVLAQGGHGASFVTGWSCVGRCAWCVLRGRHHGRVGVSSKPKAGTARARR